MNKSAILSQLGYDNWEYDNLGMLRCPHGHVCDEDGQAHDGCKSPLLKEGMI